jgi:hypothetical protein
MLLTAILVSAKQSCFNVFPSTSISKIGNKWGLKNAEIECDEHTDPPLNFVIRKTRNSLAHPMIGLEIPPGIDSRTPYKKLVRETYYILEDKHIQGKFFKMRISLRDLTRFSSEVFTTISDYVLSDLKDVMCRAE